MCNIAGYIGGRDAAPILCGMMKKESGFAGGYYSGLATVYGGALQMKKLMGDMDMLTGVLHGDRLQGNCGIIHSRSKSGGDDKWAHPFLSYDGRVAYIANGATGKFKGFRELSGITGSLEDDGVVFDSASDKMGDKYVGIRDGRRIHVSEMMAHFIRQIQQKEALPLDSAMEQAFLRAPSEIVGLCVSADDPGTIYFARYNMPLFIGRTKDEVFLASTAIAFPDDRDYISITMVPECSSGTVTLEKTTVHRFTSAIPVAPITPALWCAVRERMLSVLDASDGAVSYRALAKETRPLWPDNMLPQVNAASYEVLRGLLEEGRVRIVGKDAPGADEGAEKGIRTTQFYVENIKRC